MRPWWPAVPAPPCRRRRDARPGPAPGHRRTCRRGRRPSASPPGRSTAGTAGDDPAAPGHQGPGRDGGAGHRVQADVEAGRRRGWREHRGCPPGVHQLAAQAVDDGGHGLAPRRGPAEDHVLGLEGTVDPELLGADDRSRGHPVHDVVGDGHGPWPGQGHGRAPRRRSPQDEGRRRRGQHGQGHGCQPGPAPASAPWASFRGRATRVSGRGRPGWRGGPPDWLSLSNRGCGPVHRLPQLGGRSFLPSGRVSLVTKCS